MDAGLQVSACGGVCGEGLPTPNNGVTAGICPEGEVAAALERRAPCEAGNRAALTSRSV